MESLQTKHVKFKARVPQRDAQNIATRTGGCTASRKQIYGKRSADDVMQGHQGRNRVGTEATCDFSEFSATEL